MSISLLTSKVNHYGSLISPARDKELAVYNWHAFKHSYSKELVKKLVEHFKLKKGAWVLDPFCGGGTTLLACKELGINSLGLDILPFSVFLTNTKVGSYDSKKLRQQFKKIKTVRPVYKKSSLPDIAIVDKAFSPEIKKELLAVRSMIEEISDSDVRNFYTLTLLSVLESVSNTSKSGGFLRIVKRDIRKGDVYKVFLSKAEEMIKDVEKSNADPAVIRGASAKAKLADARKFSFKRKFDAIITSPPYPNRHDYTRIYGLELIFSFVKNNDELKQIRYDTLRSHVEARKRFSSTGYIQPAEVTRLVERIKEAGLNNSKVPEMIEGYFEDMYISLSQMRSHLTKGGKIALVVSNVRFGGVSVPVDTLLARVGEQAGLTAEAVFVGRYRGNSAQQMEKYQRRPTRESIVVWRNK